MTTYIALLLKVICSCCLTASSVHAFQTPNNSNNINQHAISSKTNVAYRSNTENEVDVIKESSSSTRNSNNQNNSPKTSNPKKPTSFLHHNGRQQEYQRQPSSTASTTADGSDRPLLKQHVDLHHLPLKEMAQRIEGEESAPDLSKVEFVPSEDFHEIPKLGEVELAPDVDDTEGHYPFAAMLQGSGPYIAAHAGETAVYYIPGEWLHKDDGNMFDQFLQDVALSRLLGMKIVLVTDCRFEALSYCTFSGKYDHAHECHNSLHVTDKETLRQVEEEAGYVRFEVERKLNKCLRLHGGVGSDSAVQGNVVGGNFYSAKAFGELRGEDFKHTGFCHKVYTDNIRQTLDNNDVVLLTTVGNSPSGGDSVNVNGHHLAASVASALGAYKLIYMANEGSVLSQKGQESQKFYQEIPVSFAKELARYHKVKVHKTGFATFEHARQNLEPRAVELLLNLSWAAWALDNGVTRAHMVNPKDGALLEELFTSKNGANTCLYHDDENIDDENGDDDWLDDESEDWNEFFAQAALQ